MVAWRCPNGTSRSRQARTCATPSARDGAMTVMWSSFSISAGCVAADVNRSPHRGTFGARLKAEIAPATDSHYHAAKHILLDDPVQPNFPRRHFNKGRNK